MKYNSLFLLVAGMLPLACSQLDSEYKSFFAEPVEAENKIDIKFDSLELQEFCPMLNSTSYITFSTVIRDSSIYYSDYLFATIEKFDKNLNHIASYLGHGKGPNEYDCDVICGHYIDEKGHHFLNDGSLFYAEYDKDFNRLWQHDFSAEYSATKGSDKYDYFSRPYTQTSAFEPLTSFTVRDGIAYNSVGARGYTGTFEEYMDKKFHKQARVISLTDLEKKEFLAPLGRRSPHDAKNSLLTDCYFSIDYAGSFFVGYMQDKNIYVYDKDFKLLYSFGQPAKRMNRQYAGLKKDQIEWDIFKNIIRSEIDNKGYYTSVNIVGDYIFRSYCTGAPEDTGGLQIYEGTTMIADITVPKWFKVAGYIAPYYYSAFIGDEENETMKIYRFKL